MPTKKRKEKKKKKKKKIEERVKNQSNIDNRDHSIKNAPKKLLHQQREGEREKKKKETKTKKKKKNKTKTNKQQASANTTNICLGEVLIFRSMSDLLGPEEVGDGSFAGSFKLFWLGDRESFGMEPSFDILKAKKTLSVELSLMKRTIRLSISN
jgi:hypothetical protein